MHPYDHPLHFKVFKHLIYIYHGSLSQSKVVLVKSHDIVVVVYFAYLLVKVMIFITQNGAPTQLIDAQCVLQI
jgi:hypothetical protein